MSRGRHKGAQPVLKSWPDWGPMHPVAQIMSRGDDWYFAWAFQANMTDLKIARASGIDYWRLADLSQGSPVTRDEIDRLATAWETDPAAIIASLPENRLAV